MNGCRGRPRLKRRDQSVRRLDDVWSDDKELRRVDITLHTRRSDVLLVRNVCLSVVFIFTLKFKIHITKIKKPKSFCLGFRMLVKMLCLHSASFKPIVHTRRRQHQFGT
jgi:hypothetical protein